MENTMKKIIYIAITIVVLGSAAIFIARPQSDTNPKEIWFEKFGVRFIEPENYFLIEKATPSGERLHTTVILAEDTTENRALFAGERPGTEGPPTVTIGIFQNDLDKYTTEGFIEGTNFSNFKLSDGKLTETTLGGESAFRYHATGLYENENVVIARANFVYMFTVSYNSPTDPIVSDFERLLESVQFSE
jgi:hypothetical protein